MKHTRRGDRKGNEGVTGRESPPHGSASLLCKTLGRADKNQKGTMTLQNST